MALPLKTSNEVLGVLDIQSDQPQAFTQEDIEILQIMADQLAIAIERINLLRRVEEQLKEIEQAYQEFTQRSWQSFALSENKIAGYKFDGVKLQPINQAPNNSFENPSGNSGSQAIPIRLRGQTIGFVNFQSRGEMIFRSNNCNRRANYRTSSFRFGKCPPGRETRRRAQHANARLQKYPPKSAHSAISIPS